MDRYFENALVELFVAKNALLEDADAIKAHISTSWGAGAEEVLAVNYLTHPGRAAEVTLTEW